MTDFFRYLQTLGRVQGSDESYEYRVKTSNGINNIVKSFATAVDAAPFEPHYQPAFTPGATAIIKTPQGTLWVRAEGWSRSCAETYDGDVELGGSVLEKTWRKEARERGLRVVESEPLTPHNWVTFLIARGR
jgi:hypothetical protein